MPWLRVFLVMDARRRRSREHHGPSRRRRCCPKLPVLPSGLWRMEIHPATGLTACHFGGQRPWFVCPVYCNGRYCGRRAAILYGAGELFACRRCYGLSYASQQQTALHRGLGQARKIRMRLGGSADLLEPFPQKPRGMHRRTFLRLRARAAAISGDKSS